MKTPTANTALLLLDMQTEILARLSDTDALIACTREAIAYARSLQLPVIYITVGFRQGAPEVSLNNPYFGGGRAIIGQVNMDAYQEIHPDIAPQPEDLRVVKRRVSGFTGSDLEVLLRAQEIRHLVLGGVLSTVREAADKDYALSVLSDCCADRDEEVHHVLITKVFPRQAAVCTVAGWRKNIPGRS